MNHSEAGKLGAKKTQELWIKRYTNNPKECKKCGKILSYKKRKNKFCDHSCAASFNNVGICRNSDGICGVGICRNSEKVRIKKRKSNCIICNKTLHKGKKFCSTICCKKFHWQELVNEMEETGCARAVTTAKKYLKEKFGNSCSVCNLTSWLEKDIVLILDHIDGNAENWFLLNLRLICPNCDSQSPTFKGRNKGNGRFVRKERYKQGLSY